MKALKTAVRHETGMPIDAQIEQQLRQQILRGTLAAGYRFPTTPVLAKELHVSCTALQKAMSRHWAMRRMSSNSCTAPGPACWVKLKSTKAHPAKATVSSCDFSATIDGRIINPGHGIECMWFVMDAAHALGETALIARAADALEDQLVFGWDETHGGIFYFLDALGKPPQQLEWDQKLWWVHIETLIALLLGWKLTGRASLLQWYQKVHDYTWSHFPDPQHGEWYGYLNQRGDP